MSGYRDDKDAAIERAEVLEKDLDRERARRQRLEEELRQQRAEADALRERLAGHDVGAEPERPAPPPEPPTELPRGPRPEGAPRSGAKRSGRSLRPLAVGALLSVMLAVSAVLIVQTVDCHDGAGRLEDARLVLTEDARPALLLSVWLKPGDPAGGGSYRLELVDLGSGARVARRSVSGSPRCYAAAAGRFWCRIRRGELELRETQALSVVAGHALLLATNPELASGLRDSFSVMPADVDRSSKAPAEAGPTPGAAIVVGNDGKAWAIDSRTLRASALGSERVAQAVSLSSQVPEQSSATVGAVDVPTGTLKLDARIRASLVWETKRSGAVDPFIRRTFLFGRILRQRLPSGAFVVVHEIANGLVFTALAQDGKELWNAIDAEGHLHSARLIGDALILVLYTPGNYVLALGARDGVVRWRYDVARGRVGARAAR